MSSPAPTISPTSKAPLHQVKLGHTLDLLPERLALARSAAMGHAELLELVLADEVMRRDLQRRVAGQGCRARSGHVPGCRVVLARATSAVWHGAKMARNRMRPLVDTALDGHGRHSLDLGLWVPDDRWRPYRRRSTKPVTVPSHGRSGRIDTCIAHHRGAEMARSGRNLGSEGRPTASGLVDVAVSGAVAGHSYYLWFVAASEVAQVIRCANAGAAGRSISKPESAE